MSQEKLINLILNDYDEFINYRKENSDIGIQEADFSRCTLDNANLSDIDFSGAIFTESNLENINFADCDLTSADFSRATLTECNFSGAILNGTNFSYATVNYCDFNEADIAGANLCESDLTDSDLSTCENLDSVRFDDATIWPEDEKLPEGFDCSYNSDLSSLRDDEDNIEVY